MTNLFELKRERKAALDAAERIITQAEQAKRPMTAEETTLFDEHMSQVKQFTAKIEPIESKNTLVQAIRGDYHNLISGGGSEAPSKPNEGQLKSDLRAALQRGTPEQLAQVNALAALLTGRGGMEAAADSLSYTGDGNIFIPEFVTGEIERVYTQFAPVVGVCRLFPTATGAPTKYPVLSDSEEAEQIDSAELTGADATVSGDTPPTEISGPTMLAYKLSSKPVFIPREVFTDSATDVVAEVIGALIARIVRLENKLYTVGSGVGEAQGFLAGCTPFTSSAEALDLDLALDLAYAVPALYRARGIFMASDTTVKYLRKLKTGVTETDQRPLWTEGDVKTGTPPTLHGYPLVINNDMDSVGTDGSFTGGELAFGDFQRFLVRQAEQATPFMYIYNVPARDGRAVIAFRRSDSRILVPEAIARLVKSGS